MLTVDERTTLQTRAWSCEHDYVVQALSLGEPFLEDGYLHFYDGSTLFLVAMPLDGDSCPIAIINRWARDIRVQRINCWGTEMPDLTPLKVHGFARAYRGQPDPWNQELAVTFSGPRAARIERRAKEAQRKARSAGITCSPRAAGPLAADHLTLLRRFVGALVADLDSVDVAHFLYAPPFLSQWTEGITIDARTDGRLAGFAQAHTLYSPRLAILCTCVFDSSIRGVSDALYSVMLGALREAGCGGCSLGMTLHQGLYAFKHKWGGEPVRAGYGQEIWTRTPDSLTAYHWPMEIAESYFQSIRAGRRGSHVDRRAPARD